MTQVIRTQAGHTGYRDQLDRTRRLLDRVQSAATDQEWGTMINDLAFQDDMWSFFQACWHIKDWVKHDPLVPDDVKTAITRQAEASPLLLMCHDICNGTKHLELTTPRGGGTHHDYTESKYESGFVVSIDCWFNDGSGVILSGKELARMCIAEWERIFESHGLAIARRS